MSEENKGDKKPLVVVTQVINKRQELLEHMPLYMQIIFLFLVLLVELFNFIWDSVAKHLPFKKTYYKVKGNFLTTDFYINFLKPKLSYVSEKVLGMDDINFAWTIIALFVLAAPIIYLLPVFLPGAILKVLSIIIGKIMSSSAMALTKLGTDKLKRFPPIKKFIEFQSRIINDKIKPRIAIAKTWIITNKYYISYVNWKDKAKSKFMEDVKVTSLKLKDGEWRRKVLDDVFEKIKYWFSVITNYPGNYYENNSTNVSDSDDVQNSKNHAVKMYEGKKKKRLVSLAYALTNLLNKKRNEEI